MTPYPYRTFGLRAVVSPSVQDLSTAVRQLLDEPLPAIVSTTNRDGTPQSSVVWIERRGNDLAFFCDPKSVKLKNLAEQSAVVVVVLDPKRTFEPGAPCYVRISGRAEYTPMADTTFPDRLARRYMASDTFPHAGDYVEVVINSESWSGIGPFPDTSFGWGD
jgi:PPOX class probable F420-dependent enzyme